MQTRTTYLTAHGRERFSAELDVTVQPPAGAFHVRIVAVS